MPDYTTLLFFQFPAVRAVYNRCAICMDGALLNPSDGLFTNLSEISCEMSVVLSQFLRLYPVCINTCCDRSPHPRVNELGPLARV